jgi:hypothetical protein
VSQFAFATDAKSEQYCKDVVDALTWAFGISRIQAVSLLNHQWNGQDFVGAQDVRYHLGEPRAWATSWKQKGVSPRYLARDQFWQQMGPFSFATDAKSEQYCREVVEELVWYFDVLPSQALSVLNRQWRGLDFVGDHDLRYHLGEPCRWAMKWKSLSEPSIRQILSEQETGH